jgi:hypothetical protein
MELMAQFSVIECQKGSIGADVYLLLLMWAFSAMTQIFNGRIESGEFVHL